MSDVVLKGEIHTSRGDLDEERELVRDGIDALALEGQESKAQYSLTEGWFSATSWIFQLVMSNVYTDKRILEDLALAQDAEVKYTRESNAALLENAGRIARWSAAALFYILFPASLLVGILTGDTLSGAILLLVSSLAPILLLRVYNMRISQEEENTDQRMADKIVEAAENGKVVAVMGEAHVDSVEEKLPEDLDVEKRGLAYGVLSKPHLTELVTPVFTAFSVLFVFYLISMYAYALFLSLAL